MSPAWPVVAHVGPQPRRLGLCHCRVPAPGSACRRRAAWSPPARGAGLHRPTDAAARWRRRPSWPAAHDPDRRRRGRKSRTGGTAAGDRRTSPPARGPAGRVRRCRARSAGLALAPARWRRSRCMPALGAHGGSRGSWPARYSSCSATSSPRWRRPPPQAGHASAVGAYTFSSRGR